MVGAFVDERDRLAASFMNCPGPIGEDREVQVVEDRRSVAARIDVPCPAALALPCRRKTIHVAGAAVVAVAGDHQRPFQRPGAGCHSPPPRWLAPIMPS